MSVKDLERGDVLRDIVNAKERSAGGERGEACGDRADELSLDSALDERTKKILARDADKDRAAEIQQLAQPRDHIDVLRRSLPERNSGIEDDARPRNSGLLRERSERAKNRRISAIMSSDGSFSMRLCMITTAASAAATASAMAGSFCRPQTSFTRTAPSSTARAATFDL